MCTTTLHLIKICDPKAQHVCSQVRSQKRSLLLHSYKVLVTEVVPEGKVQQAEQSAELD